MSKKRTNKKKPVAPADKSAAKATSAKSHTAAKGTTSSVCLVNTAGRPIQVRYKCKTIRLSPGQASEELPSHFAKNRGILRMCQKGALQVVSATSSKSPETTGGAQKASASDAAPTATKVRDSDDTDCEREATVNEPETD